jgi:hypothetical protein
MSKTRTPYQSPPGTAGGYQGAGAAGRSHPTEMPPASAAVGNGGETTVMAPEEPSAEDLALMQIPGAAGAQPTLAPPKARLAAAAVGAWISDTRVAALWSINQNRNSWVYIEGKGWRKLANNSDSAIVAFSTLAAHAKLLHTSYSYREEADGMIHETYVW